MDTWRIRIAFCGQAQECIFLSAHRRRDVHRDMHPIVHEGMIFASGERYLSEPVPLTESRRALKSEGSSHG